MKNFIKTSTVLFFLVFTVSSCEKTSNKTQQTANDHNKILEQVQAIETQIMTATCEIVETSDPKFESLFKKIYQRPKTRRNAEYYNNVAQDISQHFNIVIRKPTQEEETILKSFFISLQNPSNYKTYEIADIYINAIYDLDISQGAKKYTLARISILKEFYKSCKYDLPQTGRIHNDCRNRTCFDCCMYKKGRNLKNSNWFEQGKFLLAPVAGLLNFVGSCSYDCIVN